MKKSLIVVALIALAIPAMAQWASPELIDSAAHGPCKFAQGPGGYQWFGYVSKSSIFEHPTLVLCRLSLDDMLWYVDSVSVWSDDIAPVMVNGQPQVFYLRRDLQNPVSGVILHAGVNVRTEIVDSLHNEYGTMLSAHSSGDTVWVLYHQQWPVGGTLVALIQATKVGSGPWAYDTIFKSLSEHSDPIATSGGEVMFYRLTAKDGQGVHPTPEDHPLWGQSLCLARREGGQWVVETVDEAVSITSAVYDDENQKWFVVFRDEGTPNTLVVSGRSGAWESRVVDTLVANFSCVDVWHGKPYVICMESRYKNSSAPPWFARFHGPDWPVDQAEIVDSCEQVCSHGISVRVLPDGRVSFVAALWDGHQRCNEVRYSVRSALGIEEERRKAFLPIRPSATLMRLGQVNGRFYDVTGREVIPTKAGVYYVVFKKGGAGQRVVLVR